MRFGAPQRGIWQGEDSSLPQFPQNAAPALVNIRVARGLWLTRLGQIPSVIVPGVGTTEFLGTVYHRDQRIRLAARGDNNQVGLYDLLQGTDSTYQPVLDDSSVAVTDLASNRIHATTLTARELTYLCDGLTALRKYAAETRLCNPDLNLAAPTVAPQVIKTWYGFFERWEGARPYGWTESSPGTFFFAAPNADTPDFAVGDTTARLHSEPGAKGESIFSQNPVGTPRNIPFPSDTLALWVSQNVARAINSFRYGEANKPLIEILIDPPKARVSYVLFLPGKGIDTINYFKLKNVLSQTNDRETYLSGIVMPGRLLGPMLYRYTYYRPSTGQESSPSPSGPNAPMLFTEGASYQNTTSDALMRTAVLIPTRGPDWEVGDKIRWYRNGGVSSLLIDGNGQPIYTYLGEQLDFQTLSNGATLADATTMTVDDGSAFVPNTDDAAETYYQWAWIDAGSDEAEFVRVLSSAANVLAFADPLEFAHPDNTPVQLVYNDNVPNAVLAAEVRTIDLERDSPPYGAKWVWETGDGRLWLANFLEDRDGDTVPEYRRALGVAISNRPTPDRPNDQDIFPEFPDPYTGDSLTQGFRVDLPSTPSGDEIMWGGIFQGLPTLITRQAVYRITSFSQADWSASSIRKVLDRGTIAGDTVVLLNGLLIWASDGPSILAWDGRGSPVDISHLAITGEDPDLPTYLGDAPPGYVADETVLTTDRLTYYWESWFAVAHAVGSSIYYRLYMIPDDPLIARISDLTLLSPTTVSSAEYGFTSDDIGRGLQVTNDNLGWFDGLYRIESVSDGGVATVDRALGVFGYGYPYEAGTAALWDPFCSLRLDYDLLNKAWEPVRYWWDRDSDGIGDQALGWDCAEVQYGAGDAHGLFAAAWNPAEGDIWQQEISDADGSVPIKIQASSPRVPLAEGAVATFTQALLRLHREAGDCDDLAITVSLGGADYPQQDLCTMVRLQFFRGPGDTEILIPFNLSDKPKGVWMQLSISGNVSGRPAVREIIAQVEAIRNNRILP